MTILIIACVVLAVIAVGAIWLLLSVISSWAATIEDDMDRDEYDRLPPRMSR